MIVSPHFQPHILVLLSHSENAQLQIGLHHVSSTTTCTTICTTTHLFCALQTTTSLGIRVFEFEEFAKVGSGNPSPAERPQPEDLCTIMYTSGTTDVPKVICTLDSQHHGKT